MLLQGKRGIVFGVANHRSLAWHVGKEWRKHGAKVILVCQSERFVEKIRKEDGLEMDVLTCDVDKDEEIQRCVEKVREICGGNGKLDMMLHSIAHAPRDCLHDPFVKTKRQDFIQTMQTSVFSLIALSDAFTDLLAQDDVNSSSSSSSSIMALSFDGSRKVIPGYNIMGTAKGALETSVRYLAADLGEKNIRVNTICSSPMNTLAARGIPNFLNLRKKAESSSLLPRNPDPKDVGEVATWLASDLSSTVTGQTIFVDSGQSIV